jgi:hypothetical protein
MSDQESRVADAIIEVLQKYGDADMRAALGYMLQEPLDERAKDFKRALGLAEIALMAADKDARQ